MASETESTTRHDTTEPSADLPASGTEIELLVTVVVNAAGEHAARRACHDLLSRGGGRIVESGDCSDEEPGCWSVTISRVVEETMASSEPAALARAVRTFVRQLGPDPPTHRVSCEPPTAWTVLDDPDRLADLVPGGERLLVEAWLGGSLLPPSTAAHGACDEDPDEPVADPVQTPDPVDPDGTPRPRLGLLVDVVADRPAAAEWQARALAGRLSQTPTLVEISADSGPVRVAWDLGPAPGAPAEIVGSAVAALGGDGWSGRRDSGSAASCQWGADPSPATGITALTVFAGYD